MQTVRNYTKLILVCLSLTSAGVMRVHGPMGRRCPGSGKPPRGFSGQRTSVPSGEADQHQGVTPSSQSSVVSLSQGEPAVVQHLPIVRVLRRIPKAAREQCSSKLTSILEEVVRSNDVCSWNRLFQFATSCLRLPHRGNPHQSLASKIKDQLREGALPLVYGNPSLSKRKKPGDPLEGLARQVSRKIEDGDIRGAIRLASSEDTLADFSDNTFTALQAKHPLPHPDCSILPVPLVSSGYLEVTAGAVVRAIKSFPNSSAGGFDRLRPQHLKDLLTVVGDVEDSPLISALIAFCTLVLEGRTPEEVRPFFFGASLVALQKKSGGVRPIAVGCTLRRLVAKVAGFMVVEDMAALLAPRQLGYGVKGGAEAAVHAARKFLSNMDPDCAFVKLDFRNAFNCIRRDCMLQAVCDLAPTIYPFVHSLYSAPSLLRWGDKSIFSAEGVQQGDPLGPLLFCLTLHRHCLQLRSELCIMYLDDVTLGGSCSDILHDLEVIMEAENLGLTFNNSKSEIICNDNTTRGSIIAHLPGAQVVEPSHASLLGSPLGDDRSVSMAIEEKIATLVGMGERFEYLTAHDSLVLLRNSFAIPKLRYLLRTSPCFKSPSLQRYDDAMRSIVCAVVNIHLGVDDPAWLQATLPVKLGGLGIRSVVMVAPSAFLASSHASSDLVSAILPPRFKPLPSPLLEEALSMWSQGHDRQAPAGEGVVWQKSWDNVCASVLAEQLLDEASDDVSRARLLAVATKESGAWLHALPVSSLGLRMDDDSLRIAVGLRLGAPTCGPHRCHHCGAEVDVLGRHGLSCRKSEGRHHRHAAVNDIIHRTLVSAHVPSRLEPPGLLRSDGKRPDGVTVVPWRCGKLLVWDATCPDTLAPSYSSRATLAAGEVAALAEERKVAKYNGLPVTHSFTPVAIETLGAIGPKSLVFLKELGWRARRQSGDERAASFLLQRLSVAVYTMGKRCRFWGGLRR